VAQPSKTGPKVPAAGRGWAAAARGRAEVAAVVDAERRGTAACRDRPGSHRYRRPPTEQRRTEGREAVVAGGYPTSEPAETSPAQTVTERSQCKYQLNNDKDHIEVDGDSNWRGPMGQ